MPPVLRTTARDLPEHSPSPVSSTSSRASPQLSYTELLSRAQVNFAALPQELRAASCSPPPDRHVRASVWREKVEALVNEAGGDPSSSKWGHLSRVLRLRCTSRGYVGAARGVRVGDVSASNTQDFEWVLPDTEDEWWECEKRWEERNQGVPMQKGKTSKYWKTASVGQPRQGSIQEQQEMKAVTVREKVATWQAQVASEEPFSCPGEQSNVEIHTGMHEEISPPTKMQSVLPFPNAMHLRESTSKSVPETSAVKHASSSAHPVSEEQILPDVAVASRSEAPDTVTLQSDVKSVPKITDLSEMVRAAYHGDSLAMAS